MTLGADLTLDSALGQNKLKAELGTPAPDKDDKGRLEFFVDCSANATPEFEGRGGEELASEISNMLIRVYDCPGCVDLQKLCIIPKQQCWILYIDILLLECGGNLFDAASVAVKAALFDLKIPRVTVTQDEGHVELEISDDPYDVQTVDVKSSPCIVTLSKIGHCHVVDASQKEEACCLARLMLGVSEHGTITGMKKEGSGSLDPSSIDDMLDTGKRVGIALNKSLLEALEEEQRQGKKKGHTGFLRSEIKEIQTDCEIVWAEINISGSRTIKVSLFYRPPSNACLALEEFQQ
ncbi:RRP42 [Mytilus coruscus]|uniref:Ribosomal RNA-processing protein 42 n=1 Tax=Mytilus coruscus TaxID=42192 RepID=A0A6J8C0S6_MYTCO|nr:RRP42 [Mytilus coruscus]